MQLKVLFKDVAGKLYDHWPIKTNAHYQFIRMQFRFFNIRKVWCNEIAERQRVGANDSMRKKIFTQMVVWAVLRAICWNRIWRLCFESKKMRKILSSVSEWETG